MHSWQMAEVQQGWELAYRCKFLHLLFKEKLGSPNILKRVSEEWSKLLQCLDGLKKCPQKAQAKSSHSRVHKAGLVSCSGKLYLCCYRCTSSRRGSVCDNQLSLFWSDNLIHTAKQIFQYILKLSRLSSALMLMLPRAGGTTNQRAAAISQVYIDTWSVIILQFIPRSC